MKIILIAAAAENNALGKDNDLVWHLPDDFKRFKKLTSNHPIIMGRKTFETFPKPLPNRKHIVITRKQNYKAPDEIIVVNSLEEAIETGKKEDETLFIIGGGEIYKLALDQATHIELTRVHETFIAVRLGSSIPSNQASSLLPYKSSRIALSFVIVAKP